MPQSTEKRPREGFPKELFSDDVDRDPRSGHPDLLSIDGHDLYQRNDAYGLQKADIF